MEERTEYQVLAPDSVAWFIQAALVADRAGNVHTRDVALAMGPQVMALNISDVRLDGGTQQKE
jgi:hypothetical protein